jgi:hypothetical protein
LLLLEREMLSDRVKKRSRTQNERKCLIALPLCNLTTQK